MQQGLFSELKGSFVCLYFFQMDPAFEPHNVETRTLFGLKLEQQRNNARIDENVFKNIVTKRQDVSDITIMFGYLQFSTANEHC